MPSIKGLKEKLQLLNRQAFGHKHEVHAVHPVPIFFELPMPLKILINR
jgi:hypothetical protein